MADELVIRLKLDKSAADAAGQQFVAAEKARNKELLDDTKVQEAAKAELIKRANAAKIKAAADAVDAAKIKAKEQAEAEKQAAKDAAEAAKAARQQERDAKRATSDEAKRLARDQTGAEKAAAKEAADAVKTAKQQEREANRAATEEAKRLAREQAEAEKAASKDATEAEKQKAAAAKNAAKQQQEAARLVAQEYGGANSVIESGVRALGGMAVQLIGIGSAAAALNLVVTNFEKARDIALAAVDTVVHYREAILELAALKGQLGQSGKTVQQDLQFRAKTLQTADEARQFQLTALGVGESSIDTEHAQRLISKDEFKKAMVLGGSFQAMERGSAEAHAQLVGLLPSLIGHRTTGQEVFQKESQLYKIFQPGGAEFHSLADQYAKLAPLVTSGQYDPMEAAALLSAFSTTNKEGAGENVQQFTRATLGGIGRMKGASIEGAEKQGEYLKSIGVTDEFVKSTKATQLPFAIANKITDDMEAKKQEAAARGEEFNPYVYLKHKGYGNEQDVNALLQYQGLQKTRALQDTFLPLAAEQAMPTVQEAIKPVEDAQRTEPALLERKNKLGGEQADIAAGAPLEYYEKLRKRAYDLMKARGEVSGTYEEYAKDWKFGGEATLHREAMNLLAGEHRQHGGSDEDTMELERMAGFGSFAGVTYASTQSRAEEAQWAAQKVASVGGDILPGGGELQQSAQTSLQAAQQFQQSVKEFQETVRNMNEKPNLNARPGAPRR